MSNQKRTYGLITAIAMIIGTVIGSGIYFKVDDILTFTGGSLALGLLVLTIGASNIIFGSLSLTELANKDTRSGGIIAYIEHYMSPAIAAGFGWFQTFILMPGVVAIVAWVSALYTGILFNWNLSFESQILLGAAYILLFSAINLFSRKLGAVVQSLSTFVKLIPLLIIAIAGIFWTAPLPSIPADFTEVVTTPTTFGWLAALLPLSFAYEGWVYVTSLAPEFKHPERDLKRALIIGPIIILFTYLAFFYGMTKILGAPFILATGDKAITFALSTLFGERIGNIAMVVVIISIMGVLNGMILAGFRLPQALAEKQMLRSQRLETIDPRFQLSIGSSALYTLASLFWLAAHWVTQVTGILNGTDISEIAIVFNYMCYVVLYLVVIHLYKRGDIKSKFTGLVAPIIAAIGSTLVVIGSFITSFTWVVIFMTFNSCVFLVGYLYYKAKR